MAVGRFFKRNRSIDQFLKSAFLVDRFLIEGIGFCVKFLRHYHSK